MIKNIGAIFNLTLFIFILIGCHQDQMEIFISPDGNDANGGTREKPLKTMNKALEKSRQVQGRISKTIHLLEGNYYLNAPVTITPEDNNLSIIGEGSDKVVIKGSRLLALVWTPFRDNVWVAEVPVQMDFDQLYINGEKQVLARYPNFDGNTKIFNGYAADAIAKERVQNWKDPRGGFVHALHSGRWGGFHYEIIGVDESGELTLKGGHQNNRPSDMHPEFRMVENIFEELDDQNEWYYDKRSHKLYLWPSSGVDLNKAIVEISDLNHLVDLRGTREKPVHNVSIEGIRFEHSRRTFMEKYHPLLRSDWTIYRGGALFLDGTEFCSIIDCEFVHLGGNVIFVNGYNRDSEIRGNYIHDCGASAISFVGDSTAVRSGSYQYQEFVPFEEMDTMVGPANDLYPSDCKVVNNLIHDIGQIEKQVAGVEISMAMQIEVAQNSIYNVPRAGINISEGTWGGHIIEYNDVFNTVLETGDHGSFNSWGRDRFWHPVWDVIDSLVVANPQMPYWDAMYPTIIRNNRFRCDHGWDIDLDDGSSNYHIYNNLCLNGGIKLREGFYRTVENNIMVNNGFHPHVWFENSGDVVKRNILMTKH
ncbi:MAG: right-handed parallel beta-helix repeat-containing protein, partial [Saprospiraceae bacterium]|nr:right-handed parallel beta-helix repeat-containing protein [Saprospiraceae bacterium]